MFDYFLHQQFSRWLIIGQGPAGVYHVPYMGDSISWIEWFLSFRGNELFCAVDEDFISDRFNITGIGHDIPQFKKAYELITGSCGNKN